jgi:apolipoprotein N-acyltransferase
LRRADVVSAVALVAGVFGYGMWRMRQVAALPTFPVKALLVQLNIPQDAAKVLVPEEEVHQGYEDETAAAFAALAAKGEKPDWVLWPESALFGRLMRADDGRWGMWRENNETIRRVKEAEVQGEELVMKEDAKSYNSLSVISPDGELQSFRKHHLVIFGETIPFLDTIPFLKKIYEQQSGAKYEGSYSSGESLEPLLADAGGHRVGLIPTVCFEDTLGNLARKFARGGPQVIVNVTNDGWFRESEAADQHFANARFRAIELRRPLIRCANTGVSGVVGVTGSVMRGDFAAPQILTDAAGSHFTRGWKLVEVDVPLEPAFTLYAYAGDWIVIGLTLAGCVAGWRMRKRVSCC